MATPYDRTKSKGISKGNNNLSLQGRLTIPLSSSASTPHKKGSIIYDSRLKSLFISEGDKWSSIVSLDENGTPNPPIRIIEDNDKDTYVSVDSSPNGDTDNIYFRTAGGAFARAIFDSDGVFIATSGLVDPTTITPSAGKVAHFEGDIDVTGVIDPIGIVYNEQATTPTSTVAGKGTTWVKNDVPCTLQFTDDTGVDHPLTGGGAVEDLLTTLIAGNTTGGTDIEVSTGDKIIGTTDVTIEGVDTTGGTGGDINLTAGSDSAAGTGGNISLTAGASASGVPGSVNINSDNEINNWFQ